MDILWAKLSFNFIQLWAFLTFDTFFYFWYFGFFKLLIHWAFFNLWYFQLQLGNSIHSPLSAAHRINLLQVVNKEIDVAWQEKHSYIRLRRQFSHNAGITWKVHSSLELCTMVDVMILEKGSSHTVLLLTREVEVAPQQGYTGCPSICLFKVLDVEVSPYLNF